MNTLTKDTDDSVLILEMGKGNKLAVEILFNRYYNQLCVYCEHKTGDPEVARDIVGDVFFVLWNRKEKISQVNEFGPYLMTVTKNAVCSYYTKLKKEMSLKKEVYNMSSEIDDLPSPSMGYDVDSVYKNIHNLPAQCKKVAELYISGIKTNEIARIMNISVRTVRNHKLYAINKLKNNT